MNRSRPLRIAVGVALVLAGTIRASAQDATFDALVTQSRDEKPKFAERQQKLLAERYDLADSPADGVKMSRGKAVQQGIRVRLPDGTTWDKLATMKPEEIKKANLFPQGFLPLPHPHHESGGMVFPQPTIDEIKKQNARDLTRFDLDFDLPQHLLPEFPPPLYLTTRTDLGDMSKGKLITLDNYYERLR